jgi:hypothetical protein
MGLNMSSDTKRYQVVSAAVIVPVDRGDGPVIHTLYRGMVFDGDPTNVRVAHNAESGYIVEIGADAVAGVDAAGTPLVDDKPTVGDGNPGDPVPTFDPGVVNEQAHRAVAQAGDEQAKADAVEAKRAAAAAKLPADGSAPDGRAATEVWVEYAVRQGYDRETVEKSSKDDIRALFKG